MLHRHLKFVLSNLLEFKVFDILQSNEKYIVSLVMVEMVDTATIDLNSIQA